MEAIKEMERTMTTKGSTLRPASPESVYSLSMVLEEPPAPAERVEVGRAAAGARRRTALAP